MVGARDANEVFKENAKKFDTPDHLKEKKKQHTRDRAEEDFMKEFEIPVESVPVPSKGLVYPISSSLHSLETVDITCMTAKDENILTSRALIRKGTVLDTLLKSCLVDKTINVPNMLVGDRNALMIAIRITGYGSDYSIAVDCTSCSEQIQETFNLSELPIKRLKIEPIEQFTNQFSFTLPRLNKEVIFKFMTGQDEIELTKTFERARKINDIESVVTTQLVNSILSISGITDKGKISRMVPNMPAIDSLALRNFIEENEPGIEMKSFVTCNNCGWDGEVDIPIGVEFFWPK
ncbi:hypothetical protein CMI47_11850 [Candidatus Pacearchaeota archaeon]|nr:hypothetical protein [Candidatus Pacearchaeota archaeon]|tara:strand:- start:3081 stop:3956 length:876 start_codon:yes stop_codon:yes gene_type:complete